MSSNSSGSDNGLKAGTPLCSTESWAGCSSVVFGDELIEGGSFTGRFGTIREVEAVSLDWLPELPAPGKTQLNKVRNRQEIGLSIFSWI